MRLSSRKLYGAAVSSTTNTVDAVAKPQLVYATTTRGWLVVAGVAVLLAAAMVIENATFPGGNAMTPLVALNAALIACCVLVCYPFPVLGLIMAVALGVANVAVPGMPRGGGTELIVFLFMTGFFSYRLPGRWGVGAWVSTALIIGISTFARGGEVFEILFYLLFLGPGWFVGWLLQREKRRSVQLARLAAELAAEREHRERAAIASERARIARELHDAVAHSVSVMTLQVGVVRRRLTALPTEQELLGQAEQLGRQSVDELRRIVGLVRTDGPNLRPVPSLRQLDELVGQVRAAGTDVSVRRIGVLPELSTALEVSAYRIVQEALTNAMKHAPTATVDVTVAADAHRLTIRVSDDGPAAAPVTAGHGLIGMGERVAMLGGALQYGAAEPHGFVITAVLPLDGRAEVSAR